MFRMIPYLAVLALPLGAAETSPPEDLLRQGLYQEEANRDLDKAAENYRAVIAAHDRQRGLAASATFRLGEIARKQGDKAAAAKAFRTVVTRFPEQAELVRLSRENLTAIGAPSPDSPAAIPPPADRADEETREIERLKELAKSSPDLIDGADEKGWRPVHYAALRGQARVIGHLLANKASPSAPTVQEGFTPLHIACIKGHLGVVKTLLAAKVGLEDGVGATAKLGMIGEGQLPQLLAGNQTRLVSWGALTALDLAVLTNRREIARTLLAAGADCLQARIHSGLASQFDVGGQAGGQAGSPDPATPLLLLAIAQGGDGQVVGDLIKAGCPMESAGSVPMPGALTVAAMRNPALVPMLLAAGAKPGEVTPVTANTPVHAAAAGGNRDAVLALLEAGADVNARNTGGLAPLHFAKDGKMVGLLVDKGADLAMKTTEGDTPLSYQSKVGDRGSAVEGLIKAGSKVADPIGLLNNTSGDCLPVMLRFVVQDRAYLQCAPADAISLMVHDSDSAAFGVSEARPGDGSPTPEIGDVLWQYCRKEETGPAIRRFIVLRRTAAGGHDPVYQWEAGREVADGPKCPRLEWGDVVEIEGEKNKNQPSVPLWGSVKEPAARTVTFRLEGGDFKRTLSKADDCWLRPEKRDLPTAYYRRSRGGSPFPTPIFRSPQQRMANVRPLAFPPEFVDSARITVTRKGMGRPFRVDVSGTTRPPLLLDGDVIEFHLDAKCIGEMVRDGRICAVRGDLSSGVWDSLGGRGIQVPPPGPSLPFPRRRSDFWNYIEASDLGKVRLIRQGAKQASFDLIKLCADLPDPEALGGDASKLEPLRGKLPKFAGGDIIVLPALPEDASEKDKAAAKRTVDLLDLLQ